MKNVAHCKALKRNSVDSWNDYRCARNIANKQIKLYKSKYLEDLSYNHADQSSKFLERSLLS